MNLQGSRAVRHAIGSWLESTFPQRCADLRALWDLPDGVLEDPLEYRDREHQGLQFWPTISIVITRKPRRIRQEPTDEGDSQYLSYYAIELYGWVRKQGWDDTIDSRDALAAALEWHVSDLPSLGSDEDFLVHEDTLTVEYGDVIPVKGERFTSGALISFDLRVLEVIPRVPLGSVLDVVPIVEPL